MCIACSEFIKQTLSLKEFKSALWEVTREDEEHLLEIERILHSGAIDPEIVREKLRELKNKRR
jgi:hypothetical protein